VTGYLLTDTPYGGLKFQTSASCSGEQLERKEKITSEPIQRWVEETRAGGGGGGGDCRTPAWAGAASATLLSSTRRDRWERRPDSTRELGARTTRPTRSGLVMTISLRTLRPRCTAWIRVAACTASGLSASGYASNGPC
jgi:hypothetical protein